MERETRTNPAADKGAGVTSRAPAAHAPGPAPPENAPPSPGGLRTSPEKVLPGGRPTTCRQLARLQRTHGNQYVARLMSAARQADPAAPGPIQRYAVGVPATASCQTVIDWLNSSNPHVPNWARTRPRFNWSGALDITGEAPEFHVTVRRPGVTLAKSVDMPQWRPRDTAMRAAWNAMYATLRAHEAEHEAIADRWKEPLLARLTALNLPVYADTPGAATAQANGIVNAEWATWLAEHQAEQDAIDPFTAPLDCPAEPEEGEAVAPSRSIDESLRTPRETARLRASAEEPSPGDHGGMAVQRAPIAILRQSGGDPPSASRRVVYIDANVIDQVNRGNRDAADALRRLTATADVRISRQAYTELVNNPDIPRTATANRLIIEQLRITVGADGSLSQRVGTYDQNARAQNLSEKDARVLAAARAGGGEIWSFDRAFRNNPRGIQQNFGVTVAPESFLARRQNAADYRVGRQLLGLPPVQISLGGVVTGPPAGGGRGGGAAGGGGRGGSGAGQAGPAGGGARPRGGTRATLGAPEMRSPPAGGPSARGQAMGGAIQLALQGINFILNIFGSAHQGSLAQRQLDRIAPEIERARREQPDMGILLVFHFDQHNTPPDSAIRPVPMFSHIRWKAGRTPSEARENMARVASIAPGPRPGTTPIAQEQWIPPQRPPEIMSLRTPFPKVALGTFTGAKAVFQDVEWGGRSGFDDEGQTTITIPGGIQAQFIVLDPPREMEWRWGQRVLTTDIPRENRTARGGDVPTVSLDPINPFGDVAAAMVFPANEGTAALFSAAPRTRDNLAQLRIHTNFEMVRWVRANNIRLLQRL